MAAAAAATATVEEQLHSSWRPFLSATHLVLGADRRHHFSQLFCAGPALDNEPHIPPVKSVALAGRGRSGGRHGVAARIAAAAHLGPMVGHHGSGGTGCHAASDGGLHLSVSVGMELVDRDLISSQQPIIVLLSNGDVSRPEG